MEKSEKTQIIKKKITSLFKSYSKDSKNPKKFHISAVKGFKKTFYNGFMINLGTNFLVFQDEMYGEIIIFLADIFDVQFYSSTFGKVQEVRGDI